MRNGAVLQDAGGVRPWHAAQVDRNRRIRLPFDLDRGILPSGRSNGSLVQLTAFFASPRRRIVRRIVAISAVGLLIGIPKHG